MLLYNTTFSLREEYLISSFCFLMKINTETVHKVTGWGVSALFSLTRNICKIWRKVLLVGLEQLFCKESRRYNAINRAISILFTGRNQVFIWVFEYDMPHASTTLLLLCLAVILTNWWMRSGFGDLLCLFLSLVLTLDMSLSKISNMLKISAHVRTSRLRNSHQRTTLTTWAVAMCCLQSAGCWWL